MLDIGFDVSSASVPVSLDGLDVGAFVVVLDAMDEDDLWFGVEFGDDAFAFGEIVVFGDGVDDDGASSCDGWCIAFGGCFLLDGLYVAAKAFAVAAAASWVAEV